MKPKQGDNSTSGGGDCSFSLDNNSRGLLSTEVWVSTIEGASLSIHDQLEAVSKYFSQNRRKA